MKFGGTAARRSFFLRVVRYCFWRFADAPWPAYSWRPIRSDIGADQSAFDAERAWVKIKQRRIVAREFDGHRYG